MIKLTIYKLVRELDNWPVTNDGRNALDQRFGQHIMNIYYPDESWPQLFYEEDVQKAFALIADRLISENPPSKVIDYTGEFPDLEQGELETFDPDMCKHGIPWDEFCGWCKAGSSK